MRRNGALVAALALLTASAAVAQPAPDAPRVYEQKPAVLARYGDLPIRLDAPGVAPGRTTFTSQAEMEAHLAGLKARAPGFLLGSLGSSSQGRNLPYLIFTAEGLTDLRRIQRLRRPVVWLVGQQHGNEPAGGEAMLALAAALADGELRPLLRRVTVVVVPRANPDGAAAFTRTTAQGFDMNRDHLLATLPESRAIQAFMRTMPPDVMVDAHEYGVAGGWITRLGGLAPWDATLLHATHPEVPTAATTLAQTLLQPPMEARLREAGLSSHVYLTLGGQGRTIQTGGAAPGISRNYYGLTGAASFLIETRGIGIGRQSFQRRVATHYLAAKGVLEAVASDPGRVRRTAAKARGDLARERDPLVVGHELETIRATLPLVDVETGRDLPVEVAIQDARRIRVTETRPRPQGYLLTPAAGSAIDAFRVKGVTVCDVRGSAPVAVEAFRVERLAPITRATREATNLAQPLRVALEGRTVSPSTGWVYVPMNQSFSAVAAASLEPDSVGSHVGVGLIDVGADGIAPVYRVPQGAKPPRLGRCTP